MTNRYVTEAEKAGTKRRMANYREKLAKHGIKERAIILSEEEFARLRQILAVWRGSGPEAGLSQEQIDAVKLLTPESVYRPQDSLD